MLRAVEQAMLQQVITITGTVTDAAGDPLPGVSVLVKGTTRGTASDGNGAYSLPVQDENAVLVFSYIGFTAQEITVGNQRVINVTLTEDTQILDEIVVVGFGTQKKVNLTGAVGTAGSAELESRPVLNTSQALQGVIPGLNITQNEGRMGATPSINVRGLATIGEGSTGSPLILIDGMEGDINTINPQDIESITVLKDAASSSIYGSRAPFGVIMVTTKSGKIGRPVFNYNNSFRWNDPLLLPESPDSYSFATYVNDTKFNGGQAAIFSPEHLQRIRDYMDGKIKESIIPNPNNPSIWADGYYYGNDNVDWHKALYRNWVFSHNHDFSVSGGNESVNYYVSAGYLDMNGFMVFNQDTYKRYNVSSKIGVKFTDWAKLNYNVRFIRSDYIIPTFMYDEIFWLMADQGWPTLPLYDPNGHLYSSPSMALNIRDGGQDKTQTDQLNQQAQLILEPIANWKTFFEFNYRTVNQHNHQTMLMTYNHDVAGNPYLYNSTSRVIESYQKDNFWNLNIYTEYSLNHASGHNFKGMAGFQAEMFNRANFNLQRIGIIVPELPVVNLTTGVDINGNVLSPGVGGANDHWSTAGFFGRLNYDYQGKYLAEINLRYDGTSRFRDNKRWGLFPSVSVGWNVAREDFWSPLTQYIGMFKIRASYGELGNQNTSSWYPTYQILSAATSNGNWLINGKRPNTAVAPSLISTTLTWERIQVRNIGVDISALKNKLSGSFDYYNRYTLNMVGPAPQLPSTLGTNVPRTNNTDLKTYGFELTLGWNDRLGNGLRYSAKLSLSDSQTEITRYPNVTGALNTYREGQKYGEIWGYTTKGIAKTQQEMDDHLASLPNGGQTAVGTQWLAGDIMYVDSNGDGKIDGGDGTFTNHGDRKIIGNSTPRYSFGIDLNVDYKGFDFRAFFQGVMKRDYFNQSSYFWGTGGNEWQSVCFVQHLDYFRDDKDNYLGENLNSFFPRPLYTNKNRQVQTRYLQNASYIRLKNIQLGYTLPESLLRNVFVSKVRIFVSGENLWTGTKMFKVFDPETMSGGFSYGGNITGAVYPLSKVMSFGLNVNF